MVQFYAIMKALAAYQLLDKRGDIGLRFAYTPSLGTPIQGVPEMQGVSGYGTDYVWFIGASTSGTDQSYPGLLTTITEVPKEIKDREVSTRTPNFLKMRWPPDCASPGRTRPGTRRSISCSRPLKRERLGRTDCRADPCQAPFHRPLRLKSASRSNSTAKQLNIIMSCAPK